MTTPPGPLSNKDEPKKSDLNTNKQLKELPIQILGLYFAYKATMFRLKAFNKIITSYSWYLPLFFTQSFLRGFEDTITLKSELLPFDQHLAKIQSALFKDLLDIQAHKKRIFNSFNQAFKKQTEKIKAIDEAVAISIANGDDFLYVPKKFPAALYRRARTLLRTTDHPLKFISIEILDIAQNLASASLSSLLINLDYFGRQFGGLAATFSTKILGNELPKTFGGYVLPSLLTLGFIYNEIKKFSEEAFNLVGDNVLFIFKNTLYYPVVAGIVVELYSEIEKNHPDHLPKFLDDPKPQELKNILNCAFDLKKAFKLSNNYFSKYDKFMHDSFFTEISLTKNPTSVKRFLEAKRAMSIICSKFRLTFLEKMAVSFRPALAALLSYTLKTTYLITKYITRKVLDTKLSKNLINYYKTNRTSSFLNPSTPKSKPTKEQSQNDNENDSVSEEFK